LKKCIASILRIEERSIALCMHLQDDIGADSLDIINIRLDIEEEFGIRFTDDELVDIVKIEQILKVVEEKVKADAC